MWKSIQFRENVENHPLINIFDVKIAVFVLRKSVSGQKCLKLKNAEKCIYESLESVDLIDQTNKGGNKKEVLHAFGSMKYFLLNLIKQ